MLWKRNGRSPIRGSDLSAFIDESSEIEGRYTFSGTVMLNGKFKGEIVSTDTLIVGEKGVVKATIHAGTVVVSGEVVGTVVASERLDLRATARLFGDAETPALVVDEGAVFDGHCRMTRAKQPAEAAPPARDLSIVSVKR
jgi:cytoskeletal protein CcmA (bactofilin family)